MSAGHHRGPAENHLRILGLSGGPVSDGPKLILIAVSDRCLETYQITFVSIYKYLNTLFFNLHIFLILWTL
jgi:hypothetical protein